MELLIPFVLNFGAHALWFVCLACMWTSLVGLPGGCETLTGADTSYAPRAFRHHVRDLGYRELQPQPEFYEFPAPATA